MLQEVARARGRPFLLAARVPENLPGCRLDGLDVETWAREQLVDMSPWAAGRSRWTYRHSAALRPARRSSSTRHRRSSQLGRLPLPPDRGLSRSVLQLVSARRGRCQTFNFAYTMNANLSHGGGSGVLAPAEVHLQAYRELADPETLGQRDKTFVVQRRGGGHGPAVVPNPEDWYTPRYKYANTNMLAQLPAPLTNDGKSDALVTLFVGDDLDAQAARLSGLRLRVLLNDPAAADLPDDQKIETGADTQVRDGPLVQQPSTPGRGRAPASAAERRSPAAARGFGWLAGLRAGAGSLRARPEPVGILLSSDAPADPPMTVEKLELDVAYR